MARWQKWVGSWRFAVAVFLFGSGTMIESLQKWVFSTFGVDLFLTLALMGLTAHIVIVGINDWQPYRRWLAFLLKKMRSWKRDAELVTTANFREILAAHNQEIRDIRLAVRDLPMVPLGTDGAEYAPLPEGTNVVRLPDGTIRLALPVRIFASIRSGVPTVTVKLRVPKESDDDI